MAFTIQKAVRVQVPVKVALIAPSGGGKTKSALRLAKGFGGKTAMIDTENKRGLYYADTFEYEYIPFNAPFEPERYVEAIDFALTKGVQNIIIDSASHEWIGKGGCLEIHEKITAASPSKNSYTAWNKVTERHAKFVEAVIRCPVNLILCLRGKDEYVLDQKEGSKSAPRKVGVGAQMRDGLEYECTVTFLIDTESHIATVSKDFEDMFKTPEIITEEHGIKLVKWANSGAVPPPPPAPEPYVPAAVNRTTSTPSNGSAAPKLLIGIVDDILTQQTRRGVKYGIVINGVPHGTFKAEMADLAFSLKNQEVEYTIWKDGQYSMIGILKQKVPAPAVTESQNSDAEAETEQEKLPF